jgi:SAM-dependent methyltransferase
MAVTANVSMDQSVEIITPLREHRFVESFYDLSSVSHFWFRWRFEAFRKQARDLQIPVDAELRALDVGAGSGVLREQIEAETNWRVDITDLDLAALKRSAPGRGSRLYYDICEKNPRMRDSYDFIIVFDVLEHIESPHAFIESLAFHLRSGGWLFVNVPAMKSLYSRFDQVQGHFRRYDRSSLSREFQDTSFRIKDVRFWGLANVPLLFVRRFLLKFFSGGKTHEEIYRRGFTPPGDVVNRIFGVLMKTEMALTSKPFAGSSLLLAAQKR